MSGVRCRNAHWAIVGIKRDAIGSEILVPEGSVDLLHDVVCPSPKRGRVVSGAENLEDAGRGPQGGHMVALYLDQCDRADAKCAVGMKHRVLGILPALVAQSSLR